MSPIDNPLRRPHFSARLQHTIRRSFVDEFMLYHTSRLAPKSHILDLGGHKQHKRGAFDIEQFDFHVVCANLTSEQSPDIQADAGNVPFASETFDAVICTELLEHVPDPPLVLVEISRVLRPGGVLLLTVPFLYPIHADPFDFGRYTDVYWQRTLAASGVRPLTVEYQGYYFLVLTGMIKHLLNQVLPGGSAGRTLRGLVGWGVIWPLQRVSLWADHHVTGMKASVVRSYTTGFGIVGVKA